MIKKIGIVLIVFVVAVLALWQFGPLANIYLVPPSAKTYGRIALEHMDQGIYADTEEWRKMKVMAIKALEATNSYEETYKILNDAAKIAGGKHSGLYAPERLEDSNGVPTAKLDGDTLIITLPTYISTDTSDTTYEETVWEALAANNFSNVVIDLRNNTGGSMLPMISAISPLLSDGTLVYIGKEEIILDGAYIKDGKYSYPAADFKINCPVAVLQNERTGSSGEITLLALKGNDYETFGSASAGYTSCNKTYYLYDGAALNITVSGLTSKNGKQYKDMAILPDNYCSDALICALDYLH